ncbi:MAG: ribosome silencing factor [Bacteroidales bacterium]|nr:ribosome silencing factor [Bacteroidales bacterium]
MIKDNTEKLVKTIIEGILEKKGRDVVKINLSKLENMICKYFVICHADSTVQVNAIADAVEEFTKNNLKQRVWKKEGHENSQWILLDYSSIVVHIFQTEYRNFYNLEGLWGDAEIKRIESTN